MITEAKLCQAQTNIKFFTINHQDPDKSMTPYRRTMNYLFNLIESNPELQDQYNFEQQRTSGSFHTAISIDDLQNKAETYGIGIVQSDVLYHYLKGNHPQVPTSKNNSDLRAIAKIFPEWLHVSIPTKISLDILKKLNKQDQVMLGFDKIMVNDIGSGSFVTTINVGQIMNLEWNSISTTPIDGEFLSFTVKSPNSKNGQMDYLELGLDEPSARLIASAFPNVYRLVDSGTFTGIYENIITKNYKRASVSVDAILVCSQKTPDLIVEFLSNALKDLFKGDIQGQDEDAEFLREKFPKDSTKKDLSEINFENLPINRHYWLEEQNTDRFSQFFLRLLSTRAIFFLTIFAVLFLMFRTQLPGTLKMINNKKLSVLAKIKILLKNSKRLAIISFLFLLYHFVVAVFVYVSEHQYARENVVTDAIATRGVMNTLDWIVRQLTIGNSTDTVHSSFGLVWMGILQFSYALATSVAAFMAGDKLVKYIKHRTMNDHVIIIGWSSIGNKIIDELRKMRELHNNDLLDIIIMGSKDFEETDIPEQFKNQYFKKQSLGDLGKAQASKAKAIILLSDIDWAKDQNDTDVDLWTINRIHELKTFIDGKIKTDTPTSEVDNSTFNCEDEKDQNDSNGVNEPPRIIVEILNHRNIHLAEKNGASEVICIQNFGLELLAQAATRPNISSIFNHLLESSKESNEIYYRPIPNITGVKNYTNYSELIRFLISKDQLLEQTPIGIYRKTRENTKGHILKINPKDSFQIKCNDLIIVLAKEVTWD